MRRRQPWSVSLNAEPRAAARSVSRTRRPTRHARILVVNGYDGLDMYVLYLRHHHLDVWAAANPAEALGMLDVARPDVIVTDFAFPSGALDGPAFVKRLRRLRQKLELPIIVVSGFTQPADRRRARLAGADAFLIKPCLPDQLLGAITRMLRYHAGKRLRASSIATAGALHRR